MGIFNRKKELYNYLEGIEGEYSLNSRSKTGIIIRQSPELDFEECDISDYLSFNKNNQIIEEFDKLFSENFQEKNKYLFNKNIKELKINESKMGILDYISMMRSGDVLQGEYDPLENNIDIILNNNQEEEKYKSTIMHELLHMSSSKNSSFCGFSQLTLSRKGKTVPIGFGINEGYTEKLNREYFSKYNEPDVYEEEMLLVGGIEKIVGKEKMQEFYFDANLMGVIRYLNFYEKDLDKIIDIVFKIDHFRESRNPVDDYWYLKEEIANIYNQKLLVQKDLKLITEEEYEREKFLGVDRFINSDINFSSNAEITEYKNCYIVKDQFSREVLPKRNSLKLKFSADILKKDEMIKGVVGWESSIEEETGEDLGKDKNKKFFDEIFSENQNSTSTEENINIIKNK